ncbi:MAG: lytic transglycosylase domain-containing protein [Candidatus Latescibacteria bacterium]|nr:lytic transglycosylase domain-containing protein [Candidatus Latescibacterota bacterium]
MRLRRFAWAVALAACLCVESGPAEAEGAAFSLAEAERAPSSTPKSPAALLEARSALGRARASWLDARWGGSFAGLRRAQAILDAASGRYDSLLHSVPLPRTLSAAQAAPWVPVAMDLAEAGEWARADRLLRGALASDRDLLALRAHVVSRLESPSAGLHVLGWPPDGRAGGAGSGRGTISAPARRTVSERPGSGEEEAERFVAAALSDSAGLWRAGRAARWELLEPIRSAAARAWARISIARSLAVQGHRSLAREFLAREPSSRTTQETLLFADLTASARDTTRAVRALVSAAGKLHVSTADRFALAKRAGGWSLGATADSLAEADWLSLMHSLSDVGEASLALRLLDARKGKPAEERAAAEREALRASLLLKARRYESAAHAYRSLLRHEGATPRERADFALGLARAARGLRDFAATDSAFVLAASLDSSGTTGETAAWERAREWEDRKTAIDAVSAIRWARPRIRTSALAAAARVHEAMAWIRADSLAEAAGSLAGSGPEDAAVWFWRGWIARTAGDSIRARSSFRRAWELDPWSYEGVRARELAGLKVEATQGVPGARVRHRTRPTTPPPRAARMFELVGFGDLAMERLRSCAMGDPEPGADGCIDALEERGVFRVGRGNLDLDLRFRFPPAFAGPVFEAEERESLSAPLIWSIMRRESGYNAAARSRAGALGLLQLMVPTASRLAGRAVPEDSLLDVRLNVRLGAMYLRRLAREFGDFRAVAAAYNAGEEAVRRWVAARPEIDDLWVELIPYRETREYVKQIYAGMRRYESVYESASDP